MSTPRHERRPGGAFATSWNEEKENSYSFLSVADDCDVEKTKFVRVQNRFVWKDVEVVEETEDKIVTCEGNEQKTYTKREDGSFIFEGHGTLSANRIIM